MQCMGRASLNNALRLDAKHSIEERDLIHPVWQCFSALWCISYNILGDVPTL